MYTELTITQKRLMVFALNFRLHVTRPAEREQSDVQFWVRKFLLGLWCVTQGLSESQIFFLGHFGT